MLQSCTQSLSILSHGSAKRYEAIRFRNLQTRYNTWKSITFNLQRLRRPLCGDVVPIQSRGMPVDLQSEASKACPNCFSQLWQLQILSLCSIDARRIFMHCFHGNSLLLLHWSIYYSDQFRLDLWWSWLLMTFIPAVVFSFRINLLILTNVLGLFGWW